MKKIKLIDKYADEIYLLNLTDDQIKLLDFLNNNEMLRDDVIITDLEKEKYITL